MSIAPSDLSGIVDEFIQSLPCRAPGPYPPARATGPNKALGEKLLQAFAGDQPSELTAVTQYIAHHVTIAEMDVSDLELCIAMVEMKHLDLIGKVIHALGVDPRYRRANHFYWTGGYINYGDTLCDKLLSDINAEEAAIAGYQALASESTDPFVTDLLNRILQDEEVHLALFVQAHARCCR